MAQKGDKIYSAETWEKVSKENKDILRDYELEMKSKKKSAGTIYQYMADLKMFMCWLKDNEIKKADNVLELKKRDFRNFFLEMDERGISAARVNRVQCSIRNLLEFCTMDEDEYDYDINAMRAIKGVPKEKVREIHFVKNEHVEAMIDRLVEKGKYQLALYLAFSYESCGRRNEVAQVQKHGFLESNRTNEVTGKRGKKFKLRYFDQSKQIAKLWFAQRGEDDIDSLWVVNTPEGKKAAEYSTLYGWATSFRKLLKDISGEEMALNSHTWRHTGLENYENGTHYVLRQIGKEKLPLEALKVLANHSSIETTQSYLLNKDDELLDQALGI